MRLVRYSVAMSLDGYIAPDRAARRKANAEHQDVGEPLLRFGRGPIGVSSGFAPPTLAVDVHPLYPRAVNTESPQTTASPVV